MLVSRMSTSTSEDYKNARIRNNVVYSRGPRIKVRVRIFLPIIGHALFTSYVLLKRKNIENILSISYLAENFVI